MENYRLTDKLEMYLTEDEPGMTRIKFIGRRDDIPLLKGAFTRGGGGDYSIIDDEPLFAHVFSFDNGARLPTPVTDRIKKVVLKQYGLGPDRYETGLDQLKDGQHRSFDYGYGIDINVKKVDNGYRIEFGTGDYKFTKEDGLPREYMGGGSCTNHRAPGEKYHGVPIMHASRANCDRWWINLGKGSGFTPGYICPSTLCPLRKVLKILRGFETCVNRLVEDGYIKDTPAACKPFTCTYGDCVMVTDDVPVTPGHIFTMGEISGIAMIPVMPRDKCVRVPEMCDMGTLDVSALLDKMVGAFTYTRAEPPAEKPELGKLRKLDLSSLFQPDENDTRARITFKNVLVEGTRKYSIQFENILTRDELPFEYRSRGRSMYVDDDGRLQFNNCTASFYIPGEEVAEDVMNRIIEAADACAKRLKSINTKIKNDERNWVGKETTHHF